MADRQHLYRAKRNDSETVWEAITDNLLKAFERSGAPYIEDICRLSRSGYAAAHISWRVEGIFEIIEELINTGYAKADNSEYLFQAVALMQNEG